MTDPPRTPDTGDPAGRRSITGTPRWVKVFGIIVAVLILLFIIVLVIRGPGGHGPSRHSGGPAGHTPASSVTEGIVQQR